MECCLCNIINQAARQFRLSKTTAGASVLEHPRQIPPRITPLHLHHVLGRADRDDLPAAHAAVWPQVQDPVRRLDDVEIMLDHHDGVALVDKAVEHFEELAHILEMEAGGRLVEDVERLSSGAAREFLGEFDALRLAP